LLEGADILVRRKRRILAADDTIEQMHARHADSSWRMIRKKPAPHLVRVCPRLSEKIMRKIMLVRFLSRHLGRLWTHSSETAPLSQIGKKRGRQL
jgi:hypothetical protein